MPESPVNKPAAAARKGAGKLPKSPKAEVAAKPPEAKVVPAPAILAPKRGPAQAAPAKPAATAKPIVAKPAAVKAAVEAPKPVAEQPVPAASVAKPVAAKPVLAAPAPKMPVPEPIAAVGPEPVAAPLPEPLPALDIIESEPAASPAVVPAAVASEPEPVAAPAEAAVSQKGMTIMNETVTKVEETAQKLFGDFKARATTAYEKGTKLAEDGVEYHKANFEAIVESTKLAAKGAETLGQEAAEFGRKSFETATVTVKSFASAKSPTELFKLQSDYAKSSFDTMVAEASKASEAWLKLGNEVFQPISSRISVTVEKLKTAAL